MYNGGAYYTIPYPPCLDAHIAPMGTEPDPTRPERTGPVAALGSEPPTRHETTRRHSSWSEYRSLEYRDLRYVGIGHRASGNGHWGGRTGRGGETAKKVPRLARRCRIFSLLCARSRIERQKPSQPPGAAWWAASRAATNGRTERARAECAERSDQSRLLGRAAPHRTALPPVERSWSGAITAGAPR